MTDATWSLLRLNPLVQPHFLDHVEEFIPDVTTYFPQYIKITRPAKQRLPKTVLLPVYPGYIFVQLILASKALDQLTHAPFKAYFVKFNRNIAIVPGKVIQELQTKERMNLLVEEKIIEDPYRVGRKVRIIMPIASIEGIILGMRGENVRVDTDFGEWSVAKESINLV